MKSRIFMFFAWFAVSACAYASAGGSIINDSIQDAMTDEEFKIYEDSLLKILYPPIIHRSLDSLETIIDNTEPVKKIKNNRALPEIIIDKSKLVGEIPFISGTTPMGAKTYQVPICCPEGINGCTPHISLLYNSNSKNSSVGIGWSISGLSCITRGNKDIYHDGHVEPVRMNVYDSFYLDGIRLITLSQSSNSIIYETESGNIKVVANIIESKIKNFTVYYPDGSEATFGIEGNVDKIVYPISIIRDIDGNEIRYTYIEQYNTNYISKILYNNCVALEFEYDATRNDKPSIYIAGQKVSIHKRLKTITVKYGNRIDRIYSCSYCYRNDKSYLSTIGCASIDGPEYTPLKFHYGSQDESNDVEFTTSSVKLNDWYEFKDPSQIKVVKGRFDYLNSRQDGIIMLPNANPYWKHYRNSTLFRHSENRFDNQYKENEKIYVYTDLKGSVAQPAQNILTEKGFIDIFCADLKGNLEESVIKVNNYVESEKDRLSFSVYSANASSGLSLCYKRTFDFNTIHTDANKNKSIQPKFHFSGDFDGNGKQEILSISVHEPFNNAALISKCRIFDLENGKIIFDKYVVPYNVEFVGDQQKNEQEAANNSDKFFVLDFDGDGKSELCHISLSGTNIYEFTGNADNLDVKLKCTYPKLKISTLANRIMLLGEFNGDGKTDIMVSAKPNDDNVWNIFFSDGMSGFVQCVYTITTVYDPTTIYLIQDIDSDGLGDLVEYNASGFKIYFAAQDFSNKNKWFLLPSKNSLVVPTNIMSNNQFSQLITINDGIAIKHSYSLKNDVESLLTQAISSLGVVEVNEYNALENKYTIEYGTIYSPGQSAVFPYIDFNEPIPVLLKSTVYMSGEILSENKYQYREAILHRQGLGFRGFKSIIGSDLRNHTSINEYELSGPSLQLLKEQTFSHIINYSYDVNVDDNKIDRTRLSSVTDIDYIKGVTTETYYSHDKYGNITNETKQLPDGISIETITNYENHTAVEHGYRLGVLQWQEKKTTRENETISEATEVWMREDYPWRPAGKHYFVDNLVVKTDLYDYDTNGNITEHKTWNFDKNTCNSQDEKFIYDEYGHLTEHTDVLGLKTTYEYDSHGRCNKKNDYRGGVTQYEYDVMGCLRRTINPDNTIEDISYDWLSGEQNKGVYKKIVTQTGRPKLFTYYDGLNREIYRGETRFDGELVNVFTEYDQVGNIKRISQPAKDYADRLWTDYEYDIHDRVVKISEASGRVTTYRYHYGKNSVTTVENGIEQTKVYDSLGNLVSVADPAGEITYELAPDGLPVRVVAPDNVVTTFEYDEYRRRKSMTDPSGGTISYTYNTDDLTCTCTNARGEKIWYFYDQYNRLIKKYSPEDVTGYDYDDKGDLVVFGTHYNDGSGVTGVKSIAYDVMGRIIFTTDFYGDNESWIQRAYTYQDGNIKQIRYLTDTGFTTTENYAYANGHLTEIKLDDNTVIYELVEEDGLGMPAKVNTGEFSRFYKFDSYGFPKSRSIINNNNEGCQYIKYDFNPENGLMKSRHDLYNNTAVENFSYDGMNRLVGHGNNQVEYDIKGNITRKSDVGEFAYDTPDKPYAVSSASVYGNAIPERDQEISYFSFDRVKEIKENGYVAKFDYDGYGDRVKMTVTKNNANELTRYYLGGCYEKDITPEGDVEKIYLGGGDYYDAGAVLVRSGSDEEVIYIFRDCLGSITSLGFQGYSVNDIRYDPWGRLCNPYDGKLLSDDSEANLVLGRGFTGHEHLPWFGLINMNARLYDPVLGRFLSPDPYVQMPYNSQNFNRFSYALNNPLLYVDENGEFFWGAVAAAAFIGGMINVAVNMENIHAADGWKGLWKFAGYFAGGAVAAGIGTAVAIGGVAGFGSMLTISESTFIANTTGVLAGANFGMIDGAVSGFITGTYNSLFDGKSFGKSLGKGVDGMVVGAATGILAGSITGGILAHKSNTIKVEPDIPLKSNTITVEPEIPLQTHHFATNKNSTYTPEMEKIVDRLGLSLNDDWNKAVLPHIGRHPNEYHEWVLKHMKSISSMQNISPEQFKQLFRQHVVEPVIRNPNMLYKKYWNKF